MEEEAGSANVPLRPARAKVAAVVPFQALSSVAFQAASSVAAPAPVPASPCATEPSPWLAPEAKLEEEAKADPCEQPAKAPLPPWPARHPAPAAIGAELPGRPDPHP